MAPDVLYVSYRSNSSGNNPSSDLIPSLLIIDNISFLPVVGAAPSGREGGAGSAEQHVPGAGGEAESLLQDSQRLPGGR